MPSTALPVQAGTIQAVGDLYKRHRKDFLQPNTCTEAERDRIEAEIGQYIKACTTNIARLEGGVQHGKTGSGEVNASTAAHCHGVVRNCQRPSSYSDSEPVLCRNWKFLCFLKY